MYVTNDHDADYLTTEGTTYYWLNGINPANVPGSNGMLRSFTFDAYVVQLCAIANGTLLYYRMKAGTWTGWIKIATAS